MRKLIKPILVTGSHRSGSTWAGKNLALAPRTAYIREPFNIGIPVGPIANPFNNWFQYLCEENEEDYEAVFDSIIHFKYPIKSNLTNVRTLKDAGDLIREQAIYFLHRLHNRRPLVKAPIAVFSTEWLYRKFNMDVLIMIRHPAAFCSSLKIKDWHFDFNHFLDQPFLMKRFLGGFEDEIREFSESEKDVNAKQRCRDTRERAKEREREREREKRKEKREKRKEKREKREREIQSERATE